jgi:hypothetical protein
MSKIDHEINRHTFFLPEMFLGDASRVKKRVGHFVKKWRPERGSFDLDLVDVRSAPGLVMLRRPRVFGGESHFRCYALLDAFLDRDSAPPSLSLLVVDSLVEIPWGPLCLLGDPWLSLRNEHGRLNALLRATVRWWSDYAAVGARYLGGMEGTDLWSVPTLLQPLLRSRGIPLEVLNEPLPEGELGRLLCRYPDLFAEVLMNVPS